MPADDDSDFSVSDGADAEVSEEESDDDDILGIDV